MTSSFFLAVDVGTSRTAAATVRSASDGTITAVPFPLGRHADSAPSVVFVADGELLFGDAAARRGIALPERLVREFKRRIGDATPIFAGARRFTPEQLYALTVAWVIDTVTEREGRRPAEVSVTVPVTWGEHRRGLVSSALNRAGWRDVRLISEPEAAARHYEAENPLAPGALLCVYDLGGGTFDAVMLRKRDDGGVEVVGEPAGLDAFGGADFDDLVLRHAIAAAGLSPETLVADPDARVALAALRRECIDAKESLSFDAETVIPVLFGDGRTTVRLTRSELEAMIEDGIDRTIEVVSSVLSSAGASAEDVEAILLTGGSSRIPRIAQLLSERFDRPVAVDADPKAIIAMGAARSLAEDRRLRDDVDPGTGVGADDEPVPASPVFLRQEAPRRRFSRIATIAAVTGGALVLAAGIAVSALSPSDGVSRDADITTPSPETGTPFPDDLTPATGDGTPLPAIEPTSVTTAEPLLTPAPPGVVTDIFPLEEDGQSTPTDPSAP
ncbi:Hsp70 family protein [Planococcus sp. APC 4015]|nr:Hsp70 family protein [Planococcus sp. APC 4015]